MEFEKLLYEPGYLERYSKLYERIGYVIDKICIFKVRNYFSTNSAKLFTKRD